MSAFDKIIGYEKQKNVLKKIAYCLNHTEELKTFGVNPPHGVLLFGRPGVGKTLMAKCLIDSIKRPAFLFRHTSGGETFLQEMKDLFAEAKSNAPSVVFLDDMDKYSESFFPNEENNDSDEFSVLQSLIDECKDLDVFILATVNHMEKLPKSLYRSGRFDEKIAIEAPSNADSEKIAEHYVSQYATLDPQFDKDGFFALLHGYTCADIETIVNNAAIYAVCEERKSIQSDDLFRSALSTLHDCREPDDEDPRLTAYHEAGHAVLSEILRPHSVAAVSILGDGKSFCGKTIAIDHPSLLTVADVENEAMIALGGSLGEEIGLGMDALGASGDLKKAHNLIFDALLKTGKFGLGKTGCYATEAKQRHDEIIDEAVLNRLLRRTRLLLIQNVDFLRAVAEELLEKEYLVSTDLKRIAARNKAA